QGNVIARGYVALERLITDGCVVVSGGVGSERFPTDGGVGAAGGIVHERKVTGGSVGGTAVVKDQRISSNGGVLCAGGVEQERCCAHCGIGICVVECQRSTANTSIETAGRIQKERTPTKCCISSPDGEKTKRVAPLRCREIRKAPVRCRTDRPRSWQKRQAGQHRHDGHQYRTSIFHFVYFLFVILNSFKVCSQSLWSSAYSFRVGRSLSGFARSALSAEL